MRADTARFLYRTGTEVFFEAYTCVKKGGTNLLEDPHCGGWNDETINTHNLLFDITFLFKAFLTFLTFFKFISKNCCI